MVMKKQEKIWLGLGLATLLMGVVAMWAVLPLTAAKGDKPIAILTYMQGSVEVKKAGTEKWEPAKPSTLLYADDQLKSGKRAEAAIFYTEGSELRINADTTLSVGTKQKNVQSAGAMAVRTVKLILGEVWGKFSHATQSQTMYNIQTTSAIAAIKGTKMDTETFSGGASNFTVLEGQVSVSNDQGSVDVGAGQTTAVNAGAAPGSPKAAGSNVGAWSNGLDGKSPQPLILKIRDKGGVEKEVKVYLQK